MWRKHTLFASIEGGLGHGRGFDKLDINILSNVVPRARSAGCKFLSYDVILFCMIIPLGLAETNGTIERVTIEVSRTDAPPKVPCVFISYVHHCVKQRGLNASNYPQLGQYEVNL